MKNNQIDIEGLRKISNDFGHLCSSLCLYRHDSYAIAAYERQLMLQTNMTLAALINLCEQILPTKATGDGKNDVTTTISAMLPRESYGALYCKKCDADISCNECGDMPNQCPQCGAPLIYEEDHWTMNDTVKLPVPMGTTVYVLNGAGGYYECITDRVIVVPSTEYPGLWSKPMLIATCWVGKDNREWVYPILEHMRNESWFLSEDKALDAADMLMVRP